MHRRLLDPRMFLVAYLAFFVLAARVLSPLSALVVLAGAGAFLAGRYLSGFFELKDLRSSTNLPILELLYIMAVLAILMDLAHIGGSPLLDPSLHSRHVTAYLLAGFPIVPLSALLVAKHLRRKGPHPLLYSMIALTLLLSVLLGYRTEVAAAILSIGGVCFLTGRISEKQLLSVFIACVLAVALLGFVKSSAIGSGAGPLEVFSARIETTGSLFDHIVLSSSPFGSLKGKLHNSALSSLTYQLVPGPSTGPRTLIAEFFGAREGITVTATLLGPIYLDFGVFGILLAMGLLGFMLSLLFAGLEKNRYAPGVYAVLFSFSLIAIETGVLDIVLLYFIAALFFLSVCVKRT